MEALDFSVYARTPQLDAPGAYSLGSALISAVPKSVSAGGRKAARKLRVSLQALLTAWTERQRLLSQKKTVDSRAADAAIDNAFQCLYGRLDSLASLPHDLYPRARQAAATRDTLYPEGTKFLSLPYPAEWTECKSRIDRIESEGLADAINDLVGPECLEEIKRTHADYTVAVHGTLRGEQDKITVDVVTPFRAVCQAISAYARQIVAMADDDDPDTLEVVRLALRPLEQYREQAAKRKGAPAASEATNPPTITGPVPEYQ